VAGLAGVFWWTSFGSYLGYDFPNCVAARWGGELFAVGSVSQRGRSSVFVVVNDPYGGDPYWTERRDGHFCGFPVPPYGMAVEPTGFNVHLGPNAVSWTCPYWLMVAAWLTAFFHTRRQWRFTLSDALAGMTAFAVALAAIQLRMALIITTFLNLVTAGLIIYCLISALRKLGATSPSVAATGN
jgi:hypothetical protein